MIRTVAFTGMRPHKLGYGFTRNEVMYLELSKIMTKEVIKLIENQSITKFISGMSLGVDLLGAQIVDNLKSTYNNITLEAAIPCKEQYIKWKPEDVAFYKDIFNKCDEVHYCSIKKYTDGCMLKRNLYMLHNSSIILAVWDGKQGGTSYTVKKAQEFEKKIIIINPYTFSIDRINWV